MSYAWQPLGPRSPPPGRGGDLGWGPEHQCPHFHPQELAQRQEEEAAQQGPVVVSPASDYKDKYSHLIGKGAAKDAAHMLQANKTYGCGEATVRPPWLGEEHGMWWEGSGG